MRDGYGVLLNFYLDADPVPHAEISRGLSPPLPDRPVRTVLALVPPDQACSRAGPHCGQTAGADALRAPRIPGCRIPGLESDARTGSIVRVRARPSDIFGRLSFMCLRGRDVFSRRAGISAALSPLPAPFTVIPAKAGTQFIRRIRAGPGATPPYELGPDLRQGDGLSWRQQKRLPRRMPGPTCGGAPRRRGASSSAMRLYRFRWAPAFAGGSGWGGNRATSP